VYGKNKNVTVKYEGKIYTKEMFCAIDGKQVKKAMTECP